MKKNIFLFIASTIIIGDLFAKIPPKREFRGVWIATVKNIDWPSKAGLSSDLQKDELIRILDEHQKNKMNAIMFQVRPSADAFYANGEELWSYFIAGQQGKAPEPFYDPLEFAIREAHRRGMELHAWFNPYRATNDSNESLVSPNHITHQKPEWFFTYSKKKFFDPGLPEVRDYINKIIINVVKNYDIDGVHFDDYFYPYPAAELMPDTTTFARYPNGFTDIHDWRRNNVDLLIKSVADNIKKEKPYVKFGVSPFGIWRNKKEDPKGSDTNGLSGYSALYADVLKWTEKGWIDYVNPQIYFPFNYAPAAYEKLLDWWGSNAYGKHVYVGHGVYRLTETKNGWDDPSQMPRQIAYLRKNPNIQGSVYFSSKSVTNNLGGFQDSLRTNLYSKIALVPEMDWIDSSKPVSPKDLTMKKGVLRWKRPQDERVFGYVIYRFPKNNEIDVNNPENIIGVTFDSAATVFEEKDKLKRRKFTYAVSSLNRLKNESLLSETVKGR
ncbi:protein of unknown function DUF187 [Pseudopedobacter saltans DSM 12145]|uniref:Glycosyl hydrolase-like 10 domain-containing protein n=1 Tax=Pseudopedobacter saltans (strain ATCC 51119 / DSM 12145 / JCM 21818 / CCUG 39354 / LMG 10337 / NBRC 100064 / NCIMB 13643) TaxID=762903 RepID=F0S8T6_PSESL|nr:family 10 glycosylhydrolase [Pseudopedobacter saltans]ADY52417.1 protein of unknown function DUF187 [Pseudopedobacter saltans DSM 12145]